MNNGCCKWKFIFFFCIFRIIYIANFIIFIYNNTNILFTKQEILYIDIFNHMKWSVLFYMSNKFI